MSNKLLDGQCIHMRGGSVQASISLGKMRWEWYLGLCETWSHARPWWYHECTVKYGALLASPQACLMGEYSKL